MANIFERTRQKREQDAGLQEKKKEEDKPQRKREMSNEEFFHGRPPQSKKWVEK